MRSGNQCGESVEQFSVLVMRFCSKSDCKQLVWYSGRFQTIHEESAYSAGQVMYTPTVLRMKKILTGGFPWHVSGFAFFFSLSIKTSAHFQPRCFMLWTSRFIISIRLVFLLSHLLLFCLGRTVHVLNNITFGTRLPCMVVGLTLYRFTWSWLCRFPCRVLRFQKEHRMDGWASNLCVVPSLLPVWM